MAKKKLKIGVLFGGKSVEHEVSIESAKKVMEALDTKKYEVIPIKISQEGIFNLNDLKKYDVIFPVLHGMFGEDGTVQGLLKLIDVPFVGASVLGSAVGMDKDVMKRLFKEAGIPIGKFIACKRIDLVNFNTAKKKLGLPLFVKPANTGSSVGVSKVRNELEYNKAIKLAFTYDTKIILEEMVEGREIECGVIGNDKPIASLFGEIIPKDEFYTYQAKYTEDSGTIYTIPVKLSNNIIKKAQKLAIKTFQTLSCEGMGRVDFFLKKNGEVLVNEINTIPGPVMFRKVWEASGIPFPKLLDKLILLAIERFQKEQKLKNTFK